MLFLAGHETTANMLGNALLALYRNREQLESIKAYMDSSGIARGLIGFRG
jgi:cytochrome P450